MLSSLALGSATRDQLRRLALRASMRLAGCLALCLGLLPSMAPAQTQARTGAQRVDAVTVELIADRAS
ncbi:MAG: hypothetical protein NTV17_18650, partial [Burkholderiales bacterium]|nr:hypothetical protein [Burkholderiales bacterium]